MAPPRPHGLGGTQEGQVKDQQLPYPPSPPLLQSLPRYLQAKALRRFHHECSVFTRTPLSPLLTRPRSICRAIELSYHRPREHNAPLFDTATGDNT